MKLADFAAQRNVSKDTITAYIRRNPKKFSGHVTVNNRRITIDDEALDILEKKYPLPQPIQIIEDVESRAKLIQAQQLIIQLQQKIQDQTLIVAQAETMKILLEDKEKQLEDKGKQLEDKEKQLVDKQAEINQLKNRNLWKRILNK